MADIIDLEKRRQQQEGDKANALRGEKIDVLKKVLQCARCQLKCSRCGVQIDESAESNEPKLQYPLCSSCGDEYEAYVRLRSGEFAERYWYNEEWMEVWQTWLNHQQALDQYRDSKEFIKLLRELESLW